MTQSSAPPQAQTARSSGPPSDGFRIIFCRQCLLALSEAALRSPKARQKEDAAFEAGRAIRAGEHTPHNLKTIARWKSARRIGLLEKNSGAALTEALSSASSTVTLHEKVRALRRLKGVGVPMATAILTAIDPLAYCVIDVRALDALGARGHSPSIALYESYLLFCRENATRLNISLRDLDRALWKAGTA